MAISISGSNAISGLGNSDTNFDKVLEQLKKIESTQLNRLEAWKSDWKLRYDAFTQIIDQIKAASSMLSQLSDKNNFVTKNVASSNENIVTAVANASAQDVQHSVNVIQTASNAIWANTGKVFNSKTDVINATGTDQYFKYTYGGKTHNFKVPAYTTLESFASMLNSSSDNPGVKVSIIQTGSGYVFQIAGKDTGVDKDLYIDPDCQLEGMSGLGATTNWVTNNSVKSSDTVTNPTSYIFDLLLEGGARKTITLKGDATPQDLVTAINNSMGKLPGNRDPATLDASGNLVLEGVQSFSRRKSTDTAYVAPSTTLKMGGDYKTAKLNDAGGVADGLADTDKIKFTMTLDNGKDISVEVEAGATQQELYRALGMAVGNGSAIQMDAAGSWGIQLNGVTAIAADTVPPGGSLGALNTSFTASKGVKDTLGAELTTATTTISIDQSKLTDRIDGKAAGEAAEDLTFTVVDKNGQTHNIKIKSDQTNQDLMDAVAALNGTGGITATWDNSVDPNTLTLDGVKEFRLDIGTVKNPAYKSEFSATITVPATNNAQGPNSTGDLFYTDPLDSTKVTLEEPPKLVYSVKMNDGRVGTLTVNSGTSMKDIIGAFQDPATPNAAYTWEWKNADGNVVSAPAAGELGVRFTDKDGNPIQDGAGNDITDPDLITDPFFLNFRNVISVKGPQISGQVSESSNWSIQRSQNCVYNIDNWPVDMESSTNKITDVIEGVVINVQEVGEARLSISTDITSVEQSIQNFLDAVNSVLLTVNELMKFDSEKEVTSNDPDDIGNDNYSPSGLTNQKGSLLTGNYGVQLFKSRFTSLLGTTPPGFKAQQTASDILSGDVLASLSALGIKTDTDSTSDTYGLLVLAPSSSIAELQTLDKEHYDDLITNHLEAVVDFFCASGVGSSTSTDFRYGSHVEGITQAGVYDVTYTVEADGTITNVMVGGEPAIQDKSMPGNYFSVASGDPRGLSILIDDLTVGDHPPAGGTAMQVRIKQGLVQTTNQFLKAELVFNDVNISANSTADQIADAVALKSKNGALMSLRDNYMKVMESIDVKIEREQRRLDTWYNRQKAIFANLETTLANFEKQQESLESQLKQLSGNQ